MNFPDDLFFVWDVDEDSMGLFDYEDESRILYECLLCRDTDGKPDVIRGYDPADGIFERPGVIVEALGGIDADEEDSYRRDIERQLLEEFEARREANIERSNN